MRQKFELDKYEWDKFTRLRPIDGEAIRFWAQAAKTRNLDPKSVISAGRTFTALPEGHGKHWCFPVSLKCKKTPVYRD